MRGWWIIFNKRGMEDEFDLPTIAFGRILALFVFLAFFTVIFFYGFSQVTNKHIPPELLTLVHTERFITTCFPYANEAGRTMPRIIDSRLFTTNQLQACYSTTDTSTAPEYKLRLVAGDFDQTIQTAHLRSGGQRIAHPVLAFANGGIEEGTLYVDMEVLP